MSPFRYIFDPLSFEVRRHLRFECRQIGVQWDLRRGRASLKAKSGELSAFYDTDNGCGAELKLITPLTKFGAGKWLQSASA